MNPATSPDGIDCPIGLFDKQEEQIARLTARINAARTASAKAEVAQELQEVVQTLLDCPARDAELGDCRLCRHFSELRLQTVRLIEGAARLQGLRGQR